MLDSLFGQDWRSFRTCRWQECRELPNAPNVAADQAVIGDGLALCLAAYEPVSQLRCGKACRSTSRLADE